ncbi:MAG TPA: N-6 DNA methylase [Thermoanaerobaculia bacterium]|nr:N-6 DNA methylase [Thermoanaerobaculia bacterium]
MISAERLRRCSGPTDIVALFRELGYPVDPVDIDRSEWRRGGISVPFRDLQLIARLPHLDLFLLDGIAAPEKIATFMRDYAAYNVMTKSVIVNTSLETCSIFDLSRTGKLRRFSFDLTAPSALAIDRLNLLDLTDVDAQAAAKICDRALDRESIGRQFFIRFRAAVRDVASELAQRCDGESKEDCEQQALLILSRLLFLSFIQEKGWLNGERRFLIDRFDAAHLGGREFFATVLLPLFFACLNTPRPERDASARDLGPIPYLNGGLFDPSFFERRHPDLHLSNEVMRAVLEDVFEKFDFSVDESDTTGTHIDPEMLGKVFESLMAEDERAASGSFYTPKEIVDALTTRAIVEWLSRSHRGLRDDLHALLERDEMSAHLANAAPALVQRLEKISVLDPACGSGAFLLSALNVIETLIRRLCGAGNPAGEGPARSAAPHLRQQIVERSLYGVDLKPEAVRLCELRLWLAIVSRTDVAIDEVPPLPNLDRNILQGNALLGPVDFLGAHRGDIYRQWASGIRAQRDLVDRYRHAPRSERPALYRLLRANDRKLAGDLLARAIDTDEQELALASAPPKDLFGRNGAVDQLRCRELQARIAESRQMLERIEHGALDFFSFDVHFAPVISAGGFDVVVGNPPWVRNARIDPQSRRMVRDRYALFGRGSRSVPFHQPDLSLAFFERAIALVDHDGVVSMLMPAKIVNAAYAAPLRRFAQEQLSLLELIDWTGDARRFFNADTFPLGVVARRGSADVVRVTTDSESYDIAQHELCIAGTEWALVPPDVASILRRIATDHAPLIDALGRRPTMGVKTGDNQRFFVEGSTIEEGQLVTSDGARIPMTALCRCVRGRDLRRWTTSESQWMLWPPAAGWKDAPEWMRNLRLAYVRPEHVGVKVAWKDVSRGMAAAVLPDVVHIDGHAVPLVPNQTLYSIDAVSLDEAYVIAAILNSTIADAFLLATAERAKDDHYRYFGRTVARLPFPRITAEHSQWETLLRLSRAAHRSGRTPEELDDVVGELYGIRVVTLRAFVERRLGAR